MAGAGGSVGDAAGSGISGCVSVFPFRKSGVVLARLMAMTSLYRPPGPDTETKIYFRIFQIIGAKKNKIYFRIFQIIGAKKTNFILGFLEKFSRNSKAA